MLKCKLLHRYSNMNWEMKTKLDLNLKCWQVFICDEVKPPIRNLVGILEVFEFE